MNLSLEGVHWPAVLVSTLAVFFLGGVWYQALFGKLWCVLNGYDEAKQKEMLAARPPAVFFGGMVVAYFVLTTVMAMVFSAMGVESTVSGMVGGLALWAGLAATIGYTAHLASDKPIGVYLIDVSYQLVFLVMAGAILGGWR